MQCAVDFIKSNFRNNHKLVLMKECPFSQSCELKENSKSPALLSIPVLQLCVLHCLLTCLFGGLEYYPGCCAGRCSFGLATFCQSSVFIAPSGYSGRVGSLAFYSNASLDTRVTALV